MVALVAISSIAEAAGLEGVNKGGVGHGGCRAEVGILTMRNDDYEI
jgi:hypothetical protein